MLIQLSENTFQVPAHVWDYLESNKRYARRYTPSTYLKKTLKGNAALQSWYQRSMYETLFAMFNSGLVTLTESVGGRSAYCWSVEVHRLPMEKQPIYGIRFQAQD